MCQRNCQNNETALNGDEPKRFLFENECLGWKKPQPERNAFKLKNGVIGHEKKYADKRFFYWVKKVTQQTKPYMITATDERNSIKTDIYGHQNKFGKSVLFNWNGIKFSMNQKIQFRLPGD